MIGKRIKLIRKLKRKSQKELAKGIISVSYLSAAENEKASLDLETIRLLAGKLQINPSLLTNEKEFENWLQLK